MYIFGSMGKVNAGYLTNGTDIYFAEQEERNMVSMVRGYVVAGYACDFVLLLRKSDKMLLLRPLRLRILFCVAFASVILCMLAGASQTPTFQFLCKP